MTTGYLPATYFLLQVGGSHRTGDDMIGVSGVHYGVTISVENDGRDKRLLVVKNVCIFPGPGRVSCIALPHGGKCRNKIVGDPTGQT